jgi:hypothetical protein
VRRQQICSSSSSSSSSVKCSLRLPAKLNNTFSALQSLLSQAVGSMRMLL